MAFGTQLVLRGYNLSRDLTDGELVTLYWMFIASPLLLLATAVASLIEWPAVEHRSGIKKALAASVLPAALMAFVVGRMISH